MEYKSVRDKNGCASACIGDNIQDLIVEVSGTKYTIVETDENGGEDVPMAVIELIKKLIVNN